MRFKLGRFLLSLCLASNLFAEGARWGIEFPASATVGGMFTERFKNTLPESLATLDNPLRNSHGLFAPGLRVLALPSAKLGRHWFAHEAFQASTSRSFYYESYHVRRSGQANLLQGLLAYGKEGERYKLTVKAGKLGTAFGSFQTRYSDLDNPLIDSPLSYGSYALLRTDLIPCSVFDLQHQQLVHPNVSAYHCGPDESYRYGIRPVTTYGVMGSEIDVSVGRLDSRLQIANSSPSNPKKMFASGQSVQWAAGGGYTLASGLRLGVSAFRGPWLDPVVDTRLPEGTSRRNFPATGIGVDVQWARNRWSWNAEWQRFRFNYPNFTSSPFVSYGYAETKMIVNPILYLAVRLGYQNHGGVADTQVSSIPNYLPDRTSYEAVVGFRPNRHQLIKFGYLWLLSSPRYGPSDNVLGFQLVTKVPTFSKAIR